MTFPVIHFVILIWKVYFELDFSLWSGTFAVTFCDWQEHFLACAERIEQPVQVGLWLSLFPLGNS